MKFVKTLMAAALLTTAISTAFAGGRDDQDADTKKTLAYVGVKKLGSLTGGTEFEITDAQANLFLNADKKTPIDPKKGDPVAQGWKGLWNDIFAKALKDVKSEYSGDEDKAKIGIVAALAKAPIAGTLLDENFGFKTGKVEASLIDTYAANIVKAANPITPEEKALARAKALGIYGKGILKDGSTEATVADLEALLSSDKSKALDELKAFKVASSNKSLADHVDAKVQAIQKGKLSSVTDEQIAEIRTLLKQAKQDGASSVKPHVPTGDEKLAIALVRTLKTKEADFPVTLDDGTDEAEQAEHAVEEMIGMYKALKQATKDLAQAQKDLAAEKSKKPSGDASHADSASHSGGSHPDLGAHDGWKNNGNGTYTKSGTTRSEAEMHSSGY